MGAFPATSLPNQASVRGAVPQDMVAPPCSAAMRFFALVMVVAKQNDGLVRETK